MARKASAAPVKDTAIVKLRYLDSEPDGAGGDGEVGLQGWEYRADEPLLDGPISRRVAIIDLDPDSGAVVPGAVFVPPKGSTQGGYRIADKRAPESHDFMQVSVFSVVMRMMSLFEAPDVLGRKLRWAFRGEQLLVVPRAGKMPNAFYHRDSRSLQFFFVDDPSRAGKFVYASLAPDIVAHETTHAILDGIAPDLYDATSPQSLAMHEAIADIGAVMLAVRTDRLRRRVIEHTRGDLRQGRAFSEIASRFGTVTLGRPIRDLNNTVSFDDPQGFDLREPHDLSLLLTGALYKLLLEEYEGIRSELDTKKGAEEHARLGRALSEDEASKVWLAASSQALFQASDKFKRIVFRALDYLPPGEISFADYGRALVAADSYSNPDDPAPREFVKDEFLVRGIIDDRLALDPVDPAFDLPGELDLEQLVRSDWAAYQFAERWRKELRIPQNVPFEVRPRLDVIRKTWRKGGVVSYNRALLFKVAWRATQPFNYGGRVQHVSVMRGTALAIDWAARKVCTLLTTDPTHQSQGDASSSRNDAMRTSFLAESLEDGDLELGSTDVQLQDGLLRVRALGQLLHVTGHEHDEIA